VIGYSWPYSFRAFAFYACEDLSNQFYREIAASQPWVQQHVPMLAQPPEQWRLQFKRVGSADQPFSIGTKLSKYFVH